MECSTEKLDKWKSSRTWMFANFSVGAFAFGLSLTAYYPTEYYYFKETMKMKNADLFYGLSWAFLCISGVVSSLVGSYYVDLTKNVRQICLFSNVLNVVGNIMYVLYYSPYLVLFGQLLVGTAAARMVAGVGEISRVYEVGYLTQKLSLLGIFCTLGSVTGPCTTYFYNLVDTQVGNWKLNVGNMVGVTMATMYALQFILNFFTLENISKRFNLKEELSKQGLLENIEDEKYEEEKEKEQEDLKQVSFQEKYLTALSTLFRSKHVVFLYGLSFLASYARASITLLQPIKAAKYLSWKQTDLATFNIISTCTGAIPTAVLLMVLSKKVNDFYLLIFTIGALLIALVLMGVLPIIASNYTVAMITLYGNGILTLISTAGFHIMSRSMLAKFVPENIQTVTEAIRNSLFEFSYVIAGLTVKLPSIYLSQTMFCMAIVISFVLAWLLTDEEKYMHIEEIH